VGSISSIPVFSVVREKPQNLFPVRLISNSKRLNFENRTESLGFRAPERNGPFGERQADSDARESGDKKLEIAAALGKITNRLSRRMDGFGKAGGAIGIRTNGTVLLFTADLKRSSWSPSMDNF
jgi:hypothetical protein